MIRHYALPVFVLFGLVTCSIRVSADEPDATGNGGGHAASVSGPKSGELYVSTDGDDTHTGTINAPLRTIHAALAQARENGAASIVLRGGTYYLSDTLVLTPEDSGRKIAAFPGEKVVISGGTRLELNWQPYRDGISKARTPQDATVDQLFVNGQLQRMARYPNYDAAARPYHGAAADAFSIERAATWSDPRGGYIHAMHRAHWGGYHYRITGKNERGEVMYEGGWQNNRQMGMHDKDRMVENIFEELDAPGEWYHDQAAATLYFSPPAEMDLAAATIETVRLRHLVEVRGEPASPVRNLEIKGIVFRHTARTFMDVKEPLLRSDWTIYRGGALQLQGTEDCVISACEFDRPGGNAIFVDRYNRRLRIEACDIHDTGASGVAFVGDPNAVRNPLYEYGERQSYREIDTTPGPRNDNYPADCVVEDCLIRHVGVVEKQATGVQISMSRGITLRHCSIYDASRAGINISEGTFGGHLIEFCDVFDTVLETGDHGSFNSWGRDRFWKLADAPPDELPQLALLDAVEPTVLRNNRWRCDHGWDVDLDDGSSNYEIYNNLFLHGGLKLREGFHRRVWNNITVNNTLHPHVWYDNSQDTVTGNIFMAAYRPAGGMPKGQWGKLIDKNLFTTTSSDRDKFRQHGCDAHSLVGDPMFVDPSRGDYRVQAGSPALSLGFRNFAMDRFGVQSASLRAIARTPELPLPSRTTSGADGAAITHYWLGASLRELQGEEFSAYGVSKEAGGLLVTTCPKGCVAAAAGIRRGDVIDAVNREAVGTWQSLVQHRDSVAAPLSLGLVRNQQRTSLEIAGQEVVATASVAEDSGLPGAVGGTRVIAPPVSITTRPETHNEPIDVLYDGRLARDYGPVFANQVQGGIYKLDLGSPLEIFQVGTWSYQQNGNRGRQVFVLFGSSSNDDPGWDVNDTGKFVPIAEVETRSQDARPFVASRVRRSNDQPLGKYRWLLWAVRPVTDASENTAFQEFQVEAGASQATNR